MTRNYLDIFSTKVRDNFPNSFDVYRCNVYVLNFIFWINVQYEKLFIIMKGSVVGIAKKVVMFPETVPSTLAS